MPVATALIAGDKPEPKLAEQAVRSALERAGVTRANAVLLFLSAEFSRLAKPAVVAAARSAQCMQVFGGISAGLCTEQGWIVDQPAAAAMVFTGSLGIGTPTPEDTDACLLSCCSDMPAQWVSGLRRFGTQFDAHADHNSEILWQQGRTTLSTSIETGILGAKASAIDYSSGMKMLGRPFVITKAAAYELQELEGVVALQTLQHLLPEEWQNHDCFPLHLINAIVTDNENPNAPLTIALISANADQSLTLTVPVKMGQKLTWAIREPAEAESDISHLLSKISVPLPDFAFFFSCIGRSPYFRNGDDRDLTTLIAHYPGVPIIGTYGTGQIVSMGARSRLLQNAVVLALFSEIKHV